MTSASKRRPSVAVGLMVAGLVAISCPNLGHPSGPISQDAIAFAVQLSATAPVSVRRVHVRMIHGGHDPVDVSLRARRGNVDNQVATDRQNLWLSIVAEDPDERLAAGFSLSSSPVEAHLAFTERCRDDCERTYVLVARTEEDSADDVIDEITAYVIATYTGFNNQPPGTSAQIEVDDAMPVASSAQLSATLAEHAELGAEQPSVSWRILLTVPGVALPATGTIGSPLLIRVSADPVPGFSGPLAEISVGGTNIAADGLGEGFPPRNYSLDWLGGCNRGEDCTVPITVTVGWAPGGPTPSAGVDLALDSRLEYLEPALAPAGASIALIRGQ